MVVAYWDVVNAKNVKGEVLDHTLGESLKFEVKIRVLGSLKLVVGGFIHVSVFFYCK